MMRQRNLSEIKKTRTKLWEKTKRNEDKQSIRCRVQNIGYKDAQGGQGDKGGKGKGLVKEHV